MYHNLGIAGLRAFAEAETQSQAPVPQTDGADFIEMLGNANASYNLKPEDYTLFYNAAVGSGYPVEGMYMTPDEYATNHVQAQGVQMMNDANAHFQLDPYNYSAVYNAMVDKGYDPQQMGWVAPGQYSATQDALASSGVSTGPTGGAPMISDPVYTADIGDSVVGGAVGGGLGTLGVLAIIGAFLFLGGKHGGRGRRED